MIDEWEGVVKKEDALNLRPRKRETKKRLLSISGYKKALEKKKHQGILLIGRKMATGNHKEQIRRTDGGKNVIRDGSSRSMQREMRSSKSYYVQEDHRGFGTGLRADAGESAMTLLGRA